MRAQVELVAAAGVLAIGGCGDDGGKQTCAADSGARACLVPSTSGPGRQFKATGLRPNSDVQVTREGAANPEVTGPGGQPGGSTPPRSIQLHIGADGTASSTGGVLGIIGSRGPVTFTLSGEAGTGRDVVLSLVLDS